MASITGARTAPSGLLRQLRLPILDSYILGEILGPFIFAFLAFFLFWGFNIFFLAAKYILVGNAPFFLVMRFVLFRVPQSIPMAFPFATIFATLLGIGRLMADNELTAIRTSGVSLWRFALTPFAFGVLVFVSTWLMNEYVAPHSVDVSTRTFYQIIYHTASLPIEPNMFRTDPDTNNEFYVSNVAPDGHTMQGVQIFKPGRNGYWNETIQAKTARVEGATLVLTDAILTFYNEQGFETSQTTTPEFRIGLPLGETAAQFLSTQNTDAYTMNSKQLSQQVNALRAQGVGGEALGNLELNLADKFAFPFAAVVSVLIALPMAIRFGKKGRAMGMAMAIVAFFVYYIMIEAAAAFGSTGRMNPYLAAWLPNILFGTAGLALLWSEER
ncbi:MAG TPA: LptF/LptG family permease [Candidatus Baltobacteraceae bacterium]|nr:LptF/LptG family permease [Candidatus Baltobacteraceae bacterium]